TVNLLNQIGCRIALSAGIRQVDALTSVRDTYSRVVAADLVSCDALRPDLEARQRDVHQRRRDVSLHINGDPSAEPLPRTPLAVSQHAPSALRLRQAHGPRLLRDVRAAASRPEGIREFPTCLSKVLWQRVLFEASEELLYRVVLET